MFPVFVKVISRLSVIFAVLSLAARALGGTQPANPALNGFTVGCEGKPQPCWYGIMPGVTRAEETADILREYGFSVPEAALAGYSEVNVIRPDDGCDMRLIYFSPEVDDRVNTVYIHGCPALKLGELINRIGQPDSFGLCGGTHHHWLMLSYRTGSYVEIRTQPRDRPIRISDSISLHLDVHNFQLSRFTPDERSGFHRVGWVTAGPMWLYGRRSEINC